MLTIGPDAHAEQNLSASFLFFRKTLSLSQRCGCLWCLFALLDGGLELIAPLTKRLVHVQNLCDPAHVPYAHHGIIGRRCGALAFSLLSAQTCLPLQAARCFICLMMSALLNGRRVKG